MDEAALTSPPAAIVDAPSEPPGVSGEAIVVVADASPAEVIDDTRIDAFLEDATTAAMHRSVPELWRSESEERVEARRSASDLADLDERFDTLRIELEAALDRRIRVAVDQMQTAFDHEIEALRTLNREEAKRIRAANDEAFVRIRVSNTGELERIRAAIDEGVERLCMVLEGQLDRVWAANDVELERMRSIGAERLAEVHDVLTRKIEMLREHGSAAEPAPGRDPIWNAEPAPLPTPAMQDDPTPATTRRWLRRRVPAPH